MSRTVPFIALLALLGCGTPALTASAPKAAEAKAPVRPRVVVAVVLDQLATHTLERYLPHLDEDGALRRGIREGAFHHRVVYPYAGTYTAAGHTAIHTGAPPAVSGVVSNEVWDRARGRTVPIVDDGEHAIFGVADGYASPEVMRVEAVSDVLDRETEGHAIIASLSFKDRGAVFAGGRHPDLAVFYDKRMPGFTSSTFYGDALPPWLVAWQEAHPVDSILVPWEAEDPALLARVCGSDEGEGEGDWAGFGTTFPHDPRRSSAPASVVRATPGSSEHLLALAEEAVARLAIGEDDVPDLLALSISSTDYVAHVFGPDSWEYLDNLVRTDRALGAFLDRLERAHGPIAVLITSDHGGAPLPERVEGPSGRLMPEAIAAELEAALDRELGDGDWVSAYVQPFVYLTASARSPEHRDAAVAAAIAHLSARPEVALAADAREAPSWREDDDPVRRAVGLSVPDDAEGDVFIVPREGFVVDEDMPAGFGTSHGTPWVYDRTVTVVAWGPGVAHLETEEPLAQGRVATTIATLLGVTAPSHANPEPLPGVTAR